MMADRQKRKKVVATSPFPAAKASATISLKAATIRTQRKRTNQPKAFPAFRPIRSWAMNWTDRPSYRTEAVRAR